MTGDALAMALIRNRIYPALAIYSRAPRTTDSHEVCTIRDIIGKLVRYGTITDTQVAHVNQLLQRIAERRERPARQ